MTALGGLCVPVCSVFSEDGSGLDDTRFLSHIDRVIDAGAKIICVAGGTGEFPFLSIAERRHLAEIAVKHIAGRAMVQVHASSTRTEEAIEMARHAESAGSDLLLLLPPYFEGPAADGVMEFFKDVADSVSLPIMVYNIPVYSGFDITPDFYRELLKIENIVAIKDSTGDMLRMRQLLQIDSGSVFCGADFLQFEALVAGAGGVFWGGANAFPKEAAKLVEFNNQGDIEGMKELWRKLLPLCMYFWTVSYNPGVKAAANAVGLDIGECRRPQQTLTADQRERLEAALSAFSADG